AHDDDEQHRELGLAEPDQRQRHPAHARQRLQSERERAERILEKLRTAHEESDRKPDRHADEIADEQTPASHLRRLDQAAVERGIPEIFGDARGGGEDHRRPAAARHRQRPNEDQNAEEQRDAAEALHGMLCPQSLSATAISAASSASAGLLMSRGRGNGTLNSRTIRPGRGDIRSTRSPRQTASRTSWVTNTMVLPRCVQMRWISP